MLDPVLAGVDAVVPRSPELDPAALSSPDDLSGMAGLSVTADAGARIFALRLIGRLNAETFPLLTSCLASWVGRGLRNVVVDLTRVTAIDGPGVRALSRAAHVLARSGGSLRCVAPAALANGPLRMSGLHVTAATDHTADTYLEESAGVTHGR
jgi:anti-anti-sigma factor